MEAGQKLADLTGYRGAKDVKDLNRELAEVGEALVRAGEALTAAIGKG